ncbi:DUF6179 domain-containing protein [Anaerovorax sp. IOR16]|uniref:DUF6179 domain-containing protein n=1 Tax=Anaerovorax sp. IOR16 TaxID=2773458 RepID=UPI0019D20642|nr:DUF6179 domain-containing protein [Anaerovorax sp. IOR16]
MNIESISLIDQNKLKEDCYFESFIEEAYRCNFLSVSDIERIQFECIELLAHKVERYNGGDSSSIRMEIAENIMQSNLYTIGIYLKSFHKAEAAIEALREISINELYFKGTVEIEKKIRDAKYLHRKVLENKINIGYYTYNATIVDGIEGFFKLYNPEFDACENHITADYPTCNPIKNVVGIEFIQKYLEYIYFENMFCQNYMPEEIHHLLCGIDENYDYLILNIYEQIFTSAIGCKLAGMESRGLNLSDETIKYLYGKLNNKSSEEIQSTVNRAYCELKKELLINNDLQELYLEESLARISLNICIALNLKTLSKVFIVPDFPERKPKFFFSYGEKMDNEQYRYIVEELLQCRFLSDKLSIIESKIKSLADLEDIFFDAGFNPDEMDAIFKKLEISELAALAKNHNLYKRMEALDDLRESEQNFQSSLFHYIESLSEEEKGWIYTAADNIVID